MDTEPIYCNNFCQQLRVDGTRCSPYYAVRALWHRYTLGLTARLEHRTTGIRNLDYAGYLDLPILLPPLPEQRAIAAVLDSIDEAIERTDEVIARPANASATRRRPVEPADEGDGRTATAMKAGGAALAALSRLQ